jgi:hypothetical protein
MRHKWNDATEAGLLVLVLNKTGFKPTPAVCDLIAKDMGGGLTATAVRYAIPLLVVTNRVKRTIIGL